MNIFNKVSELGNTFFDWLVKWVVPLPGIIKGFVVIVALLLIIVGVISLLKKSFKVFGVILLIITIMILVSKIIYK